MSTIKTIAQHKNTGALELFESLASLTWGWLRDARRWKLGFTEDSISDLAMLKIARTVPHMGVFRVSKLLERVVGFDWLWVVTKAGVNPTLYVVQAKKLKLDLTSAYSYGRLKYKAGSRYQIDALQEFADWIGAIPLYCFYNHVDDDTARRHWHCCVQQSPNPAQMGCTIAPLEVVRPIHDGGGRKDFKSIHWHQDAVPWRCLFHPSCTRAGIESVSSRGQEGSKCTGRKEALEFLLSLTPGGGREVGRDRLTHEGHLVDDHHMDMQEFIGRLKLEDLVARYANRHFAPIPDRILTISLDGQES